MSVNSLKICTLLGFILGVATCLASPPPAINVQPTNTTVLKRDTASFSVSASGQGTTLSYQWYFGNNAIAGATNDTVTLPNVTSTNAGQYYVAVHNAGGTVNSQKASLTVLYPPAPNNQTLFVLTNTSLNLTLTAVDGTSPVLGYSIASAPTNGTLTALNPTNGAVTYTPAPNYTGRDFFSFAASDGTLSATGQVSLTVMVPPTVSWQPQSQGLWVGQTCSFAPTAGGPGPLGYQWFFNGSKLTGATSLGLTLSNLQVTNTGGYALVVTNPVGAVTSAVGALTVFDPNFHWVQPWTQQYSGTINPGSAASTAVDAQGNVYITGYAKGASGANDYVTVKYDSNGNLLWQAWYDNGSGNDSQAAALALDGAGNVYVTGASQGKSSGWDYATVKYDSNGNQLWVARFNGPANKDDQACAIAVDASGNVVVTGWSKLNSDHKQYLTVKYNAAGTQLWSNTYVGPAASEDDANSVALDGAGNVYVTGQSKGSSSDFDYATLKYAANGTQLWVSRYNGPGNKADTAVQVAVDGAGNAYVTGTSAAANGHTGYATLKYDSNGNQVWVGRFDPPNGQDNTAAALAVDAAGNVFVTGAAGATNGGGADFATLKYSPSGQTLWAQLYSNGSDDQAAALALDSAGDVYVTGKSQGSGTGYDIATLKYRSANGAQLALMRFNSAGGANDVPAALAVDSNFNVYVAGQCPNPLTYVLLKYQPNFLPPSISLLPASNLTLTTASLNATVNAQGGPTACYFRYGLTSSYGATTALTSGIGPGAATVTTALSGLTDGTVYHFCLVATNAAGVTISPDATFTTSVGAPSGSTLSASSITPNGATLNAQVTQQLIALSCYFQYGETTNYGNVSQTYLLPALTGLLTGGGLLGVAVPVSGLTPGQIYHYRLVINGLGTTYGQDASFVTASLPPIQMSSGLSAGGGGGSGVGSSGKMQLGMTSTPGTSFTVLCSTNMFNWYVAGHMTEVAPGQYQFTDPMPATNPACLYRIRSP